jgi:hypothetical protein
MLAIKKVIVNYFCCDCCFSVITHNLMQLAVYPNNRTHAILGSPLYQNTIYLYVILLYSSCGYLR